MSGVPILCDPDPGTAGELHETLGRAGRVFTDLGDLRDHLHVAFDDTTIVLGPGVSEAEAFAISDYMRVHRPVLGVVLVRRQVTTALMQAAMRAGVRQVVDLRDGLGLQSAVAETSNLAVALRQQSPVPVQTGPRARGRVVTVFSAKGGCGKTTLATNLAAALAERGRRQVCLVDLDLTFGDVAIALQLFPAHTIADAVPMAESLDLNAVQAILTPHSPGLTTLVAPIDPGTAESVSPVLVGRIVEMLRDQFDYVVVDTPPAFDDHVLAAFDASDVIALMATLDVPALKNLKVALEALDLLGYEREKWRIVLNRADSKVGLTVADVEATLKTGISLHIPSSRDVPAAINRGVPIVLDDVKHPVSQAITEFARELVTSASSAEAREQVGARGERRGGGLIRKRRS